jgi:hypothetical protein
MVEVFKTNVDTLQKKIVILSKLNDLLPDCKINFDLDDCDRILRVEGNDIPVLLIIEHVQQFGCTCSLLS